MFAKINVSGVINVHNVGFIKVGQFAGDDGAWSADFYNSDGKAVARSYSFEKESQCWEFVKRVLADGSRRDMLEFHGQEFAITGDKQAGSE